MQDSNGSALPRKQTAGRRSPGSRVHRYRTFSAGIGPIGNADSRSWVEVVSTKATSGARPKSVAECFGALLGLAVLFLKLLLLRRVRRKFEDDLKESSRPDSSSRQ